MSATIGSIIHASDIPTKGSIASGNTGYVTGEDVFTGLGTKMNNSRITISTATPSGGVDGDIWIQVEG